MSNELNRADIDAIVGLLRDFPADGQLRDAGDGVAVNAILCGFIERREVKKPCPTCGTERTDYGYFRITGAGRAILTLAEQSA